MEKKISKKQVTYLTRVRWTGWNSIKTSCWRLSYTFAGQNFLSRITFFSSNPGWLPRWCRVQDVPMSTWKKAFPFHHPQELQEVCPCHSRIPRYLEDSCSPTAGSWPHCLCPFSSPTQHTGHPYTQAEQTPWLSRKEKYLLFFFPRDVPQGEETKPWPALQHWLPQAFWCFVMFSWLPTGRKGRCVPGQHKARLLEPANRVEVSLLLEYSI